MPNPITQSVNDAILEALNRNFEIKKVFGEDADVAIKYMAKDMALEVAKGLDSDKAYELKVYDSSPSTITLNDVLFETKIVGSWINGTNQETVMVRYFVSEDRNILFLFTCEKMVGFMTDELIPSFQYDPERYEVES